MEVWRKGSENCKSNAMQLRLNYKLIGEIRLKLINEIIDDIGKASAISDDKFCFGRLAFLDGIDNVTHSLLKIHFSRLGREGTFRHAIDNLSWITPAHLKETGSRVFVTDRSFVAGAKAGFVKWKAEKGQKSMFTSIVTCAVVPSRNRPNGRV
jgi:hypothetical protein